MRAMILEDGRIGIRELPDLEPGPDEAIVRMSVAGVCHSDLHLKNNDWPGFTPAGPNPFGHEGIGRVETLGPGADRHLKVGDRVIVGLGGAGGAYWCGACEYCLGGKPRLCRESRPALGTYADQMRIWTKALVPLPDSLTDDNVPLACGGLTAYSAIKKLPVHGVYAGKPVAIVGAAGGLGHYAVQVASAFGYQVIGIDVGAERVEFVRSLGVAAAYDASEAAERIRFDWGGANASVVFAARVAGFELGLRVLRRGGVFVSVGMPAASEGPIGIRPLDLMTKDPLILGSTVGTVEEMRELVALAAAGKVRTHIGRSGSLEELPIILDELEAGGYPGRAMVNL